MRDRIATNPNTVRQGGFDSHRSGVGMRGIAEVVWLELTGHMSARGQGDLLSFILLYTTLYGAFGVVSPFLPTLLQSRGLHPDQIGLVLALGTGVRLVSGPLAGRIADLYDALRAVFACSALAAAVTAFGYLPAHAFRNVLGPSASSTRRCWHPLQRLRTHSHLPQQDLTAKLSAGLNMDGCAAPARRLLFLARCWLVRRSSRSIWM
jgi:MFS_1 like family